MRNLAILALSFSGLCLLAFVLDGPRVDLRDIFVPITIAALILAAVFCFHPPKKAERFLFGLVAVLVLYPMVSVPFPFAPRMSVALFSVVAFPLVLIAYTAAWHRVLVSVLVVVGLAALTVSPIDIAIASHPEKKGVYLVPGGVRHRRRVSGQLLFARLPPRPALGLFGALCTRVQFLESRQRGRKRPVRI